MISNALIELMTPVILVMLVVFAITVFVFLRTPGRSFVKFLIVPSALAASIFVPIIFFSTLGFAYPHVLPDRFIYMGHNVVIKNHKKTNIEVWAKISKTETRLYLIPYDKNTEKQLNEVKKNADSGKIVEMRRRGDRPNKNGKGNGGDNEDEYPYSAEAKTPADMMSKDGVPPQEETAPEIKQKPLQKII